MSQTSAENRTSFRMQPAEFETKAGIVIGKEVIPALLIDYSLTGCCLHITHSVAVNVGDEIRLATSKGQYRGIVRRSETKAAGETIELGIEFIELLAQKTGVNTSYPSRSSEKRGKGDRLSAFLVIANLIAWGIAGYLVFRALT